MKTEHKIVAQFNLFMAVILLLSALFLGVAQASPPTQDPRPPTGGGGGGGGGSSGGGTAGGDGVGGAPTEPGCASLIGQVINWGLGPQGEIETELKTGSWRTATTSASDGNFGFGGLGIGIATLHVAISPKASQQPLIQDAGVYLNCDYLTIANIALYSGSRVDPPATIEMSAPSQTIAPGSIFEIVLTIKNSLPNDSTNVIVTNMMPRGFTALKVSSSMNPKDAQIVNGGADGQLVIINLDKLPAGAEATLRITVNADVDLVSGTEIRNTATLFYRESAADQSWLDFTVGGDELPIPAASAAEGREAGAEFVPPAELTSGGGAPTENGSAAPANGAPAATGASTAPAKESTASEEAVPPGNMPPTGGDLISLLDPNEEAEGLTQWDTPPTLRVGVSARPVPDNAVAENNSPVRVIMNDKRGSGPPLTVAVATLFLGLLALGSGITYLTHRT